MKELGNQWLSTTGLYTKSALIKRSLCRSYADCFYDQESVFFTMFGFTFSHCNRSVIRHFIVCTVNVRVSWNVFHFALYLQVSEEADCDVWNFFSFKVCSLQQCNSTMAVLERSFGSYLMSKHNETITDKVITATWKSDKNYLES